MGDNRVRSDVQVEPPEVVIPKIPPDATLLISGFGSVGYPKIIPPALANDSRDYSLTVISAGSAGPEVDAELTRADAIERRFPYQSVPEMREAINDGQIAFQDYDVSTLGDRVQYGGLANGGIAVVEALAVGSDWVIPTTSIGQTPAFLDTADYIIVEVNTTVPEPIRALHDIYRPKRPPDREPIPLAHPGGRIGGEKITFDAEKLLAVVKSERRGQPYEFRAPTSDDQEIARNLRSFLEAEVRRTSLFEDSLRIQFGVGSLGNALMGAVGDADIGDRDLIYFGEVVQDGILDLLDDGELEAASATALALSRDGQRRLYNHLERYAEDIVLRPADLSNHPSLIDRFGVVGVNSGLEVDVFGHVNSTHVNGTRLMNGIGGSGDFNRHAAISVLALPSTAAGGDVSRIVPMVPHVDHTEHDIDVIVTEQGLADVRGFDPRERATAIVENCAHPRYQDKLQEYVSRAKSGGGHVIHDLDTAFSWDDDH